MNDLVHSYDCNAANSVILNSCCDQLSLPRSISVDLSNASHAAYLGGSVDRQEYDSGVKIDQWLALTQPALWKCILLVANSLAKVDFDLYKKDSSDGNTVDKDHISRPVIRRPSKLQTSFDWKRQVGFHAAIWGNYVGFIKRNPKTGRPIEIVTLNPCFTEMIKENGRVYYASDIIKVAEDGTEETVTAKALPENVIHVANLSFNGVWGLNVIDYMAGILGLSVASRKFGASYYGRGGNPSGILKLPIGLKDEQKRQEFIKNFNQEYTGLSGANKVLVLEDEADFKPVTHSIEMAQLVEVRELSSKEVANFMGFPPSSVGAEGSVAFKSYEMSAQMELDQGIDPWFCNLESECDVKLLSSSEFDNTHEFMFNREQLKRVDYKTQLEGDEREIRFGGKTVNEYRASKNRPLYTGLPEADKPQKPVNQGYIDDQLGATKTENSESDDEQSQAIQNVLRESITREVNKVCQAGLKACKTPQRLQKWVEEDWGLTSHQTTLPKALADICSAYGDNGLADRIGFKVAIDLRERLTHVIDNENVETYQAEAEKVIDSVRSDTFIEELMESLNDG